MRHVLTSLAFLALAGCSHPLQDLGREPPMTPVGAGLNFAREPLPTPFPAPVRRTAGSLWDGTSQDLFRDLRAAKVGDVVTVNISIDDKATFDNTSDRSRVSKGKFDLDLSLNALGNTKEFNPSGTIDSESSSKGDGSIDRSEKLRLAIAAVVTEVLPNGNLVISGSQEVRVNFELRQLNIAGIVRPKDISRNNTVAYDKIAEARISYGGRGRLTDVQQPAVGQQIYDTLTPF